jgi:Restriction endonuclease
MEKSIAPKEIRYIKLGRHGRWEPISLDRGEIHFGFLSDPHELAVAGDWEAIVRHYVENKQKLATARAFAHEIEQFYTLGPDCLWITFARDRLWWCFANPDVHWLGEGEGHGARMRRTIGGWHGTNVQDEPLWTAHLSTRLTQVQFFRRTICKVHERDYLLRKINGLAEPITLRAQKARKRAVEAAEGMIQALHWADFETMVDLIFARSGWQRVSSLGGTLKDVDLLVVQPTTGETAFVQVKSKAKQQDLDDYLERYEASECARMFFVCHTPQGQLTTGERPDVHLWARSALAEAALKSGLYDWLMDRTA